MGKAGYRGLSASIRESLPNDPNDRTNAITLKLCFR